jgi:hypothetical protein
MDQLILNTSAAEKKRKITHSTPSSQRQPPPPPPPPSATPKHFIFEDTSPPFQDAALNLEYVQYRAQLIRELQRQLEEKRASLNGRDRERKELISTLQPKMQTVDVETLRRMCALLNDMDD